MKQALILMVDDTPANLRILGTLLDKHYKTAIAKDGFKALEFVKKKRPDLILLDIMMPDMDGFEVCTKLKASPETRDIPVIFLTAKVEAKDIIKGFELGAVDYVTKPFWEEELLARVKTHVTLRNSQKRIEEQNLQLQQETTERKAAEIALQVQKSVLNTMFDHAPIVMMLVNTEGWVENINYTGVQSIGRPKEDVLGLLGGEVFRCVNSFSQGGCGKSNNCQQCPVRNTVMETFRTGNGFHKREGELTLMSEHGPSTHYLLISTAYLKFHDGEKVLLSLDDITARKQAEEQLKQAKEELEKLNASKDKFFSIIAHDLRGPLGTLHGLAEILVENIEGYSKDKLIQFLTTQRNAAKNLLALLENLLTWSRIQRGMIEFYPENVDIEWVISRNLDLFTPTAEHKQITLTRSIPEQVFVYADQSMINTVIRNLISNALKFTDSGGAIAVSVRQDDTCIKVSVADTGIGIDVKHIPQLFQIDAKYQRKGTANEQGTGLGLILCKEFVERNGGEIWVKSDAGKGTTFTFILPLPQNSSHTHLQPENISGSESDQGPALPPSLLPDSGILSSSTPLIPPSQEILKTLLDAAMIGDIMSIRQQVTQLKTSDPQFAPFVDRLSQLADGLMVNKIQEFLTQYIGKD